MKNAATKLPAIGNINQAAGQVLPINWDTYVSEQAMATINYYTGTQPYQYNLEQTTYRLYAKLSPGSGITDSFYLVGKDDLSKTVAAEKRLSKDDLFFASCVKLGFVKLDKDGCHANNMEVQYFGNAIEFPADAAMLKGAWDCGTLSAEVNGNAGLFHRLSLTDSQHVPSVLPTAAGEQVATDCECGCVLNPIAAMCGNQEIKINHKWSPAYKKPLNADGDIWAVLTFKGYTAKGCAEKFCGAVDAHGANQCPIPGVSVIGSNR